MAITYRETKSFQPQQLERLFLSVNWESGNYPDRLVRAMENSTHVVSAWDGERLVGLVRALDDGRPSPSCTICWLTRNIRSSILGRSSCSASSAILPACYM